MLSLEICTKIIFFIECLFCISNSFSSFPVLQKLKFLFGFANFSEKGIEDLKASWWIIGLGLVLATLLSFIWIFLLRCMAGLVVWTTISLMLILFSGLLGFSVYKYLQIDFNNTGKFVFYSFYDSDYSKVQTFNFQILRETSFKSILLHFTLKNSLICNKPGLLWWQFSAFWPWSCS